MKVDFRKIEVATVSGEVEIVDFSKIIGNALFTQAKTFETHELGRSIWKDGEVEVTDEDKKILDEMIPQFFPAYIVRTALLNAIK